LRDGDRVRVEFWQFKVTKLDGVLTVDHPANDSRPRTLLVIGLLLLPLSLGAMGTGIVAARRRAAATAAPTMSPVAMSDVLWR
jgi:hypothetical protein